MTVRRDHDGPSYDPSTLSVINKSNSTYSKRLNRSLHNQFVNSLRGFVMREDEEEVPQHNHNMSFST